MKQQTRKDLKQHFEEEMQQMIVKRDAEHKKQLESMRREMEAEKQKMQEVCRLCVATKKLLFCNMLHLKCNIM